MLIAEHYRQVASEIVTLADSLDEEDLNAACLALAQAHHVMVQGCGREGLQLQGFAMRLAQMGRPVSVQGDMAAPRLGKGDLFLTSAGSGSRPIVSTLCRAARAGGAEVIYITAEPSNMPAGLANLTLILPAQSVAQAASPVLPLGSAYEGALFLLLEAMAQRLMQLCEQTPKSMSDRQTNME